MFFFFFSLSKHVNSYINCVIYHLQKQKEEKGLHDGAAPVVRENTGKHRALLLAQTID